MGDLRRDKSGERLSDTQRSSFAVRLGTFYGALFLIYGIHLLYFPVWLDLCGLSAQEIAIVTGVPFFVRFFVTPLIALFADLCALHRVMVIGLAWTGLALALVISQATGFWPILLAAVPFALVASTIMPLTEALAVAGVRSSGLDYGRMRLWGSLTFMGVGLLGGVLIDRFGPGVSIWLLAAGTAATVAAGHCLPRGALSFEIARRGVLASGVFGSAAVRLITSRVFLLFLISAGAVQGAHGMFYTFGSLHWRSQGISTAMVGILWAVGVIAEVLLFAYSSAVIRRAGPVALIIAGCAAAISRWGIMSLDPPLWLLFPLQVLHGLTYGASHLGAIHFIARAVPEAAGGTAQALYLTVAAGVMMGGAMLLSGPLYAALGGGAYSAMAALASIGLAAGLALARCWGGGPLGQSEGESVSPTAPAQGAQ